MHNHIRSYAWGSRTALANLLGEPSPAREPQAELWIGAHPERSSLLVGDPDRSLAEVIALDPGGTVGNVAEAAFGPRLPFLLKVLAAAEPLSLQAHPSPRQARSGFAREERAGVPIRSPNRNYRDQFSKPELICALTEFHALCGFRDPIATIALLDGLGAAELRPYTAVLSQRPDSRGVQLLFSTIMTLPIDALETLLAGVLAACAEMVGTEVAAALEYRTVLELNDRYPGDRGVLASLLLNRITLAQGQAIYLPTGNLHAYVSGVGVEIMANSDNVLRGGLTRKHVDVDELLAIMDFSSGDVPILSGQVDATGELTYPAPVPEFRLSRLDLDGEQRNISHRGPQVLLNLHGEVTVTDSTGTHFTIGQGQSIWVPAAAGDVRLTGTGVVFRATDGLAA
jgi:mannose-6-phosphate isomerase